LRAAYTEPILFAESLPAEYHGPSAVEKIRGKP
jgi:hypothetical protein